MDLLLTHYHQKSKNTTSEYLVQNLAILQILLIVSEFNQPDIHRSVCQLYILLVILWITLRKHIMREIKKILALQHKYSQITWENTHHRIRFWKRLYTLKWTLRTMKLLPRCHSFDFMKILRCSQKRRQKSATKDPKSSSLERNKDRYGISDLWNIGDH